MKIKDLSPELYPSFVTFNKAIYPEREKVDELLEFRVLNSPHNDMELNVVLLDDNDDVVGQAQYYSTSYYHEGKTEQSLWGYDLIVKPALRKLNYGLDLLEYVSENRARVTFASGVGNMALKIEKAILGVKVMGFLKKSIKIVNILNLPFAINRRVSLKNYPQKINNFVKVTDPNRLGNLTKSYNSELLEFCRDNEFLAWRFFEAPYEYAFYKSVDNDNYFVVRTIVKNHITAVVLVDYRCDLKQSQEITEIINAAVKLTNRLFLPVLITASSTIYVDTVLQEKSFKVIGRDRVMTIYQKGVKAYQQEIAERKFVFTTLADSDGEILW